jgi:2-polyprenyl-3-methyl-5-hydroxy-6-metoxy-1,4-benzoquinol methylase
MFVWNMPSYLSRTRPLQRYDRILLGITSCVMLVVFCDFLCARRVYAESQRKQVVHEMGQQAPTRVSTSALESAREVRVKQLASDKLPFNTSSINTKSDKPKKKCPFTPPKLDKDAIQANGGWLYDKAVIAEHHVEFDDGFGTALSSFLASSSIYDIGAGVGQLGALLKKKQSLVDYSGFDGGNNIESMWGMNTYVRGGVSHVVPEICWIDASVPVTLPIRDWVVSIEVGEHIPPEHEAQFMDNLVGLCTNGVIMSWAIPGQGGRGHINEKSNTYIVSEMKKRGFKYDKDQSETFRNAITGTSWWLKSSVMVFRRIVVE